MLKNMTVKELREIAKRESVKGYSTMVKAELVALLTRVIEDDHEVALNIDADMEKEKHMKEAGAELPTEIKAFPGKTLMGRIAAYKNDNGRSGFLTARQQRRIAKKWKSAISKGYSLDVVMGDK